MFLSCWRVLAACCAATSLFAAPAPRANRLPKVFTATCYTVDGETASGTQARVGIVAADPDVLPLGSKIRVSGAGKYSGTYMVEDTGRKIKGAEIDLHFNSAAACKEFGKKQVQVRLIKRGDNSRKP